MQTHVNEKTPQDTPKPLIPLSPEPRWKMWGCLALFLVGLLVAVAPRIQLSQWDVASGPNSAFDEAVQWTRGRMALSDAHQHWEAPSVDGKRYNVVGYAFVLLSLIGLKLSAWTGAPPYTFSSLWYIGMVAVPLPLIAYGVLRQQARSAAWGAVLAGYLIAGTSLRPVLLQCQASDIYAINHVLAVCGLLIFSADMLGRRRIWPAAIGLALSIWSRQMTCLYVLPFLWLAPRGKPVDSPKPLVDDPNGRKQFEWSSTRAIAAVLVVGLLAGVPMTLNYIKLGDPLDTGYRGLYAGRTDRIARDAQQSFWGLRWFQRHFLAMNLTVPGVDIRSNMVYLDDTDRDGGSIWLATPLLLGVFLTAPRWWRDASRRALMLSTIPVIAGLYGYHTTAATGAGYYRYSLDFIPVWFAVIAPYVVTPRAAPWTLGCFAWSILYHHMLLP